LYKDKIYYILVNAFSSLLRFVRSFVFMKYLNFTDLGLVTVVSTIISMFGMLQFGLLNGGYRILSLRKLKEDEDTINNLIYTYFVILFAFVFMLVFALKGFGFDFGVSFVFVILAIIFGIITLISNWINNQLSAHMSFKALNYLELASTILSLPLIFLIPKIGMWGAILGIFSTPLIYVLCAYVLHPHLIPRNFQFDLKIYRWILSFGFIPFISGIFVQLHSQIERWSILSNLDIEALGKFSLPLFYATVFMMVPLSVNKLFFPPSIQKFSIGEFDKVKKILKNYVIFNIIYATSVFVVTYYLFESMVTFFLPNHFVAIQLVWCVFPGLIALLFLQPLEIIYHASVRLYPVLWTYLTSVLFMFALVLAGTLAFEFSLTTIAIIKSLVIIFIFLVLLLYYLKNTNNLWRVNPRKEDWRIK
jgi:O-antigen/teichoic acid export membrane protein